MLKRRFFKKNSEYNTEIPKIVVNGTSGDGVNYNRLKDNVIFSSDNGKNILALGICRMILSVFCLYGLNNQKT